MANQQISERFEKRKIETYARTLLEAAKTEDRVYENIEALRVDSNATPEFRAVLSEMASQGDLDKLSEVFKIYCDMVEEDRQTVGVTVTTAVPLNNDLRAKITRKCEMDLGRNVFLIERVDPTVIGGIVLSVNGHRYDATVRHQLDQAHKIMTQPTTNSEV